MTRDEFELKLLETLAAPSFWLVDQLPDGEGDDPEIDAQLVSDIAEYLVVEEELFGDIEQQALYKQSQIRARVIGTGVMIYGWTKYREIQSG